MNMSGNLKRRELPGRREWMSVRSIACGTGTRELQGISRLAENVRKTRKFERNSLSASPRENWHANTNNYCNHRVFNKCLPYPPPSLPPFFCPPPPPHTHTRQSPTLFFRLSLEISSLCPCGLILTWWGACPLLFFLFLKILVLCLFLSLWPFQLYFIP